MAVRRSSRHPQSVFRSIESTYVKDVGTAGPHGAAARPIAAAMVMGAVSVLETGEDLFTVVRNVAEAVVGVENAAALRLKIVDGHPGVGTLEKLAHFYWRSFEEKFTINIISGFLNSLRN